MFNEVHVSTLDEDLSFGLSDGWWRFTDIELRGGYPLLQVNQWTLLFAAGGYRSSDHTTDSFMIAS